MGEGTESSQGLWKSKGNHAVAGGNPAKLLNAGVEIGVFVSTGSSAGGLAAYAPVCYSGRVAGSAIPAKRWKASKKVVRIACKYRDRLIS